MTAPSRSVPTRQGRNRSQAVSVSRRSAPPFWGQGLIQPAGVSRPVKLQTQCSQSRQAFAGCCPMFAACQPGLLSSIR